MTLFFLTSAFVGFIHSLAPGHWLPVVLISKSRNWSAKQAVFGAIVAASGHILLSVAAGLAVVVLGEAAVLDFEEIVDHYAGPILILFGGLYAANAFFRHSECHGMHSHHGPEPRAERKPFYFLFSLGLAPCVAVLPVFISVVPFGHWALGFSILSFIIGVLTALISATLLVWYGIAKLDHPILEHHGDVIAGATVVLMGLVITFIPALHGH